MKSTKQTILVLAAIFSASLTLPTLHAASKTEAQLLAQAKISRAQAEKIALAQEPGEKIQSEEIENEHNALVWSFDMVKPGSNNATEVLVNAKTGKIVDISTETPADQAKEKAEDTAAGRD